MKIEMQDLPKVRDALDKLLRDQHNLATVADVVSDFAYRVIGTDGVHAGEISNDELVGIFQARIDDTLKHLRQRYQIDFNPAPIALPPVNTNPAAPPARNPGPPPYGGLTEADEDAIDMNELTR